MATTMTKANSDLIAKVLNSSATANMTRKDYELLVRRFCAELFPLDGTNVGNVNHFLDMASPRISRGFE